MNVSSEDPRDDRKVKAAKAGLKAAAWLNTKRASRATARAISQNAAMVTAVAASVGVAGVAGYSAHQAADIRGQVASMNARVAALDAGLSMATARVANVNADLTHLATQEAKTVGALGALRVRLTAMGESMAGLKTAVAGMPADGARTEALARKVSELAAKARDTAQLAADAASAVALDDHADAYARQTAAEATAAATKAQQAAQRAQDKADAAASAAAAAERELYAPHVFHFADVSVPADIGDVLIGHADVDLTGEYKVTLSADGAAYAYDWYVSGATLYLHGTGGEGAVQHQSGTTTYTFDGPIGIDIKASATGGDDVALARVFLTLTKIRS